MIACFKKTSTVRQRPLAIYPVLAFVLGCGTWIGTPKKPKPDGGNAAVSLSIQGVTPGLKLMGQSIAVIDKSGVSAGTINVTSALVALREIQLKLTSEESGSESQFVGPFIVDLLSNKMTPSPAKVETSAGTYNEIILKLEKLKAANATTNDPLINRTFYIKGNYVPVTGQSKQFTLAFETEEDFVLGSRQHKSKGTDLLGDSDNSLIIKFQTTQWFKFNDKATNKTNVDFSDLSGDVVELSEGAQGISATLRKVIIANIKQSLKYGRDQNGDGKLDKSENDDNEAEED